MTRPRGATKRVDEARRLLDGGAEQAALAQVVAMPGGFGRRYHPGGSNDLAGQVISYRELPAAAGAGPMTVTPGYAYVIVDVDYQGQPDTVACDQLAALVDEWLADVRPTGVDVVRVRSGGVVREEDLPGASNSLVDGRTPKRWRNEHLWIVTGYHTFDADMRTDVARLVRDGLPGTQIVGAAVGDDPHGQQVRPPGSMHRSNGWPRLDYQDLFERLTAPSPTRQCFQAFTGLLRERRQIRKAPRHRITMAPSRGLDDWALDYLEHGIPNRHDRSAQLCRLVGHMLSHRWQPDDIIDRLVSSPAAACLNERLGNATLYERVRDDVARIAAKHRPRERPRPHAVVGHVVAHWPHMTLPDGGTARWLTQSGRVVLAALCRHVIRTGHGRIIAQQRTLADAAGVSLATMHRGLHRWVDVGVLDPTYDERGQLVAVEIVPGMLGRLLPDGLTETSDVHTPALAGELEVREVDEDLDQILLRHDAWLARPPGAANISVPVGRACQTVAATLAYLSAGATSRELADILGVSVGHVNVVVARLRYHRIVAGSGGAWRLVDDPQDLHARLDAAAELQNTSGLLADRRVRHDDEIRAWRATKTPIGALAMAA